MMTSSAQRPDPHGLFITLEGIEGVGKSSQLQAAADFMRARGRDVVVTREPGGTPAGEAIRQVLLDTRHSGLAADTELLLIFAARAEHVARVIRPALQAGRDVLSDRFTDASYAYQGGGRGIPAARIAALEQWVHPHLEPDLTLLLDAPVELALARANGRGKADRFEQEQAQFFEAVRSRYLALAAARPERFRVIDAAAGIDTVRAAVIRTLEEALA